MKVIWFNGNLGNQVFYCKYKEFLQKKYPENEVRYYSNAHCPKICVEQYFELTIPEKIDTLKVKFIFEILGKIFRRIPLTLVPKWYCTRKELNHKASYFENYLQDKSFFENEDSSWLQVKKPEKYSESYLRFEKMIMESNSVAVHIRRGDYIKPGSDYEDLSATNYYDKAMDEAMKIYPNAQFYFFSDDLDFVKSVFSGDNMHYVDCNRGKDSYLDILLMSKAKINIIANSTFSYWGAYMGHEKKIVMYSNLWYRKESGRHMPNIMLNNWKCIDSKRNK